MRPEPTQTETQSSNLQTFNTPMLTIRLDMPESVYAEYAEAADRINQRFEKPERQIEAKSLIVFALAGYDAETLCGKFELALRLARAEREQLPNPVVT